MILYYYSRCAGDLSVLSMERFNCMFSSSRNKFFSWRFSILQLCCSICIQTRKYIIKINEKPFRFHCNICGVNMNKHEWSPWFWAQTECCSALCFSCPGCACSLWPLWARSPCASEPHAASPFPSAEHGAACGSVPPLFPSPHGHSVLPSLPSPASKCTLLTPDVSFATARITKV